MYRVPLSSEKVPSIVSSVLFLKSICAVIVGTLKAASAHLWRHEKNNWTTATSRLFGLNGYICVTVFPKIQKCFASSEIDAGFIPKLLCLLQCLVSFIRNTLYAYVGPTGAKSILVVFAQHGKKFANKIDTKVLCVGMVRQAPGSCAWRNEQES